MIHYKFTDIPSSLQASHTSNMHRILILMTTFCRALALSSKKLPTGYKHFPHSTANTTQRSGAIVEERGKQREARRTPTRGHKLATGKNNLAYRLGGNGKKVRGIVVIFYAQIVKRMHKHT